MPARRLLAFALAARARGASNEVGGCAAETPEITMAPRILSFLTIAASLVGAPGLRAAEATAAPAPKLWYQQPAAQWVEALPIGNGRLGAMIFGGVEYERLQLNEDTLWAGRPYDPVNPEARGALPEIRRLLHAMELPASVLDAMASDAALATRRSAGYVA